MVGGNTDCLLDNEYDHGQVIIGNAHAASLMKYPDGDEWHYLPFPSLVFPQLLEPELLRLKVIAPKPRIKRRYSQSYCTAVSQLLPQTDINLKVNAPN